MTSKGAGTPLDRLGFLLARHGAITDTRIRHALGVAGQTPRHAMTLMYLDAGPMSQQTLIERLEVDPSQLVGILNDLERDELAQRRRDPADRRRHIVEMTPAGAAALRLMNKALDEVERALFADLSECDRKSLRDLLGRIRTPADHYEC
ncbi:MarR family winged helix-turn-helix transcriptional regulator [Streptomyces sp. A5-4]|uniref:MarR family winged helix-turn-helix transcriptional regulator n=1 Tax=Streptomyces sp. A5-4 TaxID=3384771 RepID=UPI003DA9BD4D